VVLGLWTVPVVLWAVAPLPIRFETAQATVASLGILAALVGFTAFASNLILGSRLGPMDRLFGGLDKLFVWHRRIGLSAFGLVTAHVVLILTSRAMLGTPSVTALFKPSLGYTYLSGAVAFCLFAAGVVVTLFARIDHETFVYVQRGFGFVFVVGSLHAFKVVGAKAYSPSLTYYLLFLAAVAIIAFLYRPLFGYLFARRHSHRVESVLKIGPDLTEVVLRPQAHRMSFIPGQFVYVSFDPKAMGRQGHVVSAAGSKDSVEIDIHPSRAAHQMHPFSIASSPSEEHLRVVAKAVGDYTVALRGMTAGAAAEVTGPFGGFSHLKVGGKRQVWIAGGIGVTPFLSMAASLPDDYEIDLFYCTEDEADAYFMPELTRLAKSQPKLSVTNHTRARDGLITASRVASMSPGLYRKDILMCGPAPMMDALTEQLGAIGVSRRRIHFEKFTLFSKRQLRNARRNDFETVEG
jgi:predicted ferric reductase